ncbi:MAG: hypothetical protein BJ554DRAFT_2232 [Olpidium bornovanus]|uniref:Peptide hydrolase n=1 Tax=Olpidium bornovanus TaxID=278681 RepID=A0A8H7ZR44_9FUNG|nr:MAG: hypothetical protein BJ554DRAFT_2232 [Olpidium bornovanus]
MGVTPAASPAGRSTGPRWVRRCRVPFAGRPKAAAGAAHPAAPAALLLVLAAAAAAAASAAAGAGAVWTSDAPTPQQLATVASLSDSSRLFVPDGQFLAPLLVPRVPGTAGNEKVRAFIADHFRKLDWEVEVDKFTGPTPVGDVEFANLIVTKSPAARRRLVLAAHYDSKHLPAGEFIGATDSAVPCAILLDLAYTLNDLLDANAADRTLQMIFFDGEEAFRFWTATDSTYGSRHLAAKWGSTFVLPVDDPECPPESLLDKIDVFILLDLLGASDPSLPNMQSLTTPYYQALKETESSLAAAGLVVLHASQIGNSSATGVPLGSGAENGRYKAIFNDSPSDSISDDHLPFMERGVPIVHLINYPFPPVWHKLTDNADAIDPVAVYNLNLIFRAFLARYFRLEPTTREPSTS